MRDVNEALEVRIVVHYQVLDTLLTHRHSASASFLGDPEFPRLLYRATRGGKILMIQGLFSKYSRLALSKPFDRPVAIAGLLKRLINTIGVQGDFGILDERDTKGLLRRTLLWHRGAKEPDMKCIDFSESQAHISVPSWSWMANTGGIDYLDLDFGHYKWSALQSPWSYPDDYTVEVDPDTAGITLVAHAQICDLQAALETEIELHLDIPGSLQEKPLCAVLGKAFRADANDDRKHCVMMLAPTLRKDKLGNKIHRRIGAGILPGKCISPNAKVVHIQ